MFRKGRPASVVSDRGSQLVAGGVVLANKDLPINKLDWKTVVSQNSATTWTFVPIGGQHRNGISESTVKVMKKSMALALNPGVELTYSEMVTLLAKITFSINSKYFVWILAKIKKTGLHQVVVGIAQALGGSGSGKGSGKGHWEGALGRAWELANSFPVDQ